MLVCDGSWKMQVACERSRRRKGMRVENRVRITAELAEVSTDHHLWAETPGLSVQTDLD
jgi:hypothetical protein